MKNKSSIAFKIRRIPSDSDRCLEEAVAYIRSSLQKLGLSEKQMESTVQLSEETIETLKKYSFPGAPLFIRIRKFPGGETRVFLSMQGEAFDPYDISADVMEYTDEANDTADTADAKETENAEDADDSVSAHSARSVLFRSHGEYFKYKHINKINRVRILTEIGRRSMNNAAFVALALGVLFGLLVKFVFPPQVAAGMSQYILDPFSTRFILVRKAPR